MRIATVDGFPGEFYPVLEVPLDDTDPVAELLSQLGTGYIAEIRRDDVHAVVHEVLGIPSLTRTQLQYDLETLGLERINGTYGEKTGGFSEIGFALREGGIPILLLIAGPVTVMGITR